MKKRLIGLLCVLSACSASFAHADESIFTPTSGPACTDRSRAEFGLWRCPGPGGYVAEYADEGNLAAVSVWMPSHRRKATQSVTWRGAGRVFGGKLQWRLNAGRPVAAILRVWRTDTKSDGQERQVEELMVIRVSIDGLVGSLLSTRVNGGANEIAEKRSEDASVQPCLDDW
jgi:hypothetical protein